MYIVYNIHNKEFIHETQVNLLLKGANMVIKGDSKYDETLHTPDSSQE